MVTNVTLIFVNSIDGIKEACDSIESFLPKFETHVITQVADSCKQHLDAANSVPRQYRRTNREVWNLPHLIFNSKISLNLYLIQEPI